MSTSDFELALRLQEEMDRELLYAESHENNARSIQEISASPPEASRKRAYTEFDLDGTQQIVHPLWESLDPTPDIFSMFRGFDTKFFQGKLYCVELEWSKKMYSCAGICYQRRNGFGKACTIRLSEPLLKLRSRQNLVETLLHEMIHAYLFILNVREGNGGHGPNFRRIMTNINKAAGTNITVYHTFHDEVNFYKTHIWRCNGICQHRGPFFGYVRRTANRAPGPNDQWWAHHKEQCGGTFLKVSQPDPVPRNQKGKASQKSPKVPVNKGSKIDNPRWGMVKKSTPTGTASRASTIVVRKPPASNTSEPVSNTSKKSVPSSTGQLNPDLSAGRSLSNVVGFKDLNGTTTKSSATGPTPFSTDHGRPLGASTPQSRSTTGPSKSDPRTNVRDIWNKKYTTTSTATSTGISSFPSTATSTITSSSSTNHTNNFDTMPDQKRPRLEFTPLTSNWVSIDDDIQVEDVVLETVTIFDESDTTDGLDNPEPRSDHATSSSQRFPVDKQSGQDSQETIKREIIDSCGDDLTDSDIELIDCDYDDNVGTPADGLCDRTITDNLFSWNKSTEDLNKIHMTDEDNAGNPDRELVACPVCNIKCERESMSDHLDGCFGLSRKIDPKKAVKPSIKRELKDNQSRGNQPNNIQKKAPSHSRRINQIQHDINEEREYNRRILSELEEEERNRGRNSRSVDTPAIDNEDVSDWTSCPVCTNSVKTSEINDHLDFCLSV